MDAEPPIALPLRFVEILVERRFIREVHLGRLVVKHVLRLIPGKAWLQEELCLLRAPSTVQSLTFPRSGSS